jgi:hypothetical protein
MPRNERVIDLDGSTGAEPVAPVGTYTVLVDCENCEYSDTAELPKGTKISDATCPECGCTELVRHEQPYGGDVRREPEPQPGPSPGDIEIFRDHMERIARERQEDHQHPPFVPPRTADPLIPIPMTPQPMTPREYLTPRPADRPATWCSSSRQEGRSEQLAQLNAGMAMAQTPIMRIPSKPDYC